MNVLFFYIGEPSPVIETKLELIKDHALAEDKVLILKCNGQLPNCHWNLKHRESKCAECCSKFENGIKMVSAHENVTVKQFSSVSISDINAPKLFNSIEDLKAFKYDGENIGWGIAAGLISVFRDHRLDTVKYHSEVMLELQTSVSVYETLRNEIDVFKPDRIYIFNGRLGTHLPVRLICESKEIEYFTYEVGNRSNTYTLLHNSYVHNVIQKSEAAKLIAEWTTDDEIQGASILTKRRQGGGLGIIPVYTEMQQKNILPTSFKFGRRNIAIFNSTIDEYAGVENWVNPLYLPDETAGIHQILESFKDNEDYVFYLRIHPHLKEVASTTSQLVDIRDLAARYDNLCVIPPDSNVDSYALLDACDITLTFGSTIGVEATFWGKPSILAGRAAYMNFGVTYTPQTHHELIELLKNDPKPLSATLAAQYQFWEATRNSVSFRHFKQTGIRQGLAYGTFDGVVIKANRIPAIWEWLMLFPRRIKKALLNPSLIIRKIKTYA